MGGVIAYRALFLDARAAQLVTDAGELHQLPDVWRVAGGVLLLLAGFGLAFISARKRRG